MNSTRTERSADADNSSTRRVVTRQRLARRLPTGRALVGGLLITVAAAGVFVAHRSASQPPTTRYVVATRPVAPGQTIHPNDLGTIAIDLPDDVAAVPATRVSDLVGRVAVTGLEPLDLVRPSDALDEGRFVDPDAIEVSVDLPAAQALLGVIHSGSIVDVLSTDPEGDNTEVLATGVRVTSTQDEPDGAGIGSTGSVQVLLSVSGTSAATALVDAALRSNITLVLPRPNAAGAT